MSSSIKQLPHNVKPRELLLQFGEKALSNRDLLSIILRTGTKKESVLELSNRLLIEFGDLFQLKTLSIDELMTIDGIGKVRAIEMKAMIELGTRIHQANQLKLGTLLSSQSAGDYLIHEMKDFVQEHLMIICLNAKNQIVQKKTIFIGTTNQSIAEPRDILREALKSGALKIIVAHNHPSGNPEPSQEDITFTKRLLAAGEIVGIQVIDHIVIGNHHYISLREYMTF